MKVKTPVRFAVPIVAALSVVALIPSPAGATVSVFPVSGARVAAPTTQLTFRGVSPSALKGVVVTGSRSGGHRGTVMADSDGQGGSFVPLRAFAPGEVITVQAPFPVLGAKSGRYQFTVAQPAGAFPYSPIPNAKRVRGDVQRFHSRPDLVPAAVVIDKKSASTAPGEIFLSPQQGPVQKGPMILGPDGRLVWFEPLPRQDISSDLRVQSYQGRPVLTWWQGRVWTGVGIGEDVIDDSSYRRIATVRAGNGVSADLHEFRITPQGTALITAYYPVWWNSGRTRRAVLDAVVQEIDIPTGLVLFQWDSLDHVPIGDSEVALPPAKVPYDYFHVNAVEPDRDGNLVVSGRNVWTAYKVDHASGRVLWQLGGKHSSFKMGPGASFAFQHDVRVRSIGDMWITMFDNGAGPPSVHHQSRGLKLLLDFKRMTAYKATELTHGPPLLANFEGDYQQLAAGESFVGWGQQGYFTEFNSRGQVVFDGHFVGADANYRVYRFPWIGIPATTPAVAYAGGKTPTVYASWNGATVVSAWRVLTGSSPSALSVVRTVPDAGFETAIPITPRGYAAVQAVAPNGVVIGTTRTIATG